MKFEKGQAIFNLFAIVSLTLAILVWRPPLRFDYEFENFFSRENDELQFYQQYRETFENDNDYLLLALGNNPDIFDSIFLEKAFQLQLRLDSLALVEATFSILTLEEPLIGPFGTRQMKVLDWSTPPALLKTKSNVLQSKYLQQSMINPAADFLLVQIKNKQLIAKEEGDVLYRQIFEIVSNSGIRDFHIAGKIRAQGEFVSLMQDEFAIFLIAAFLLISLVLWIAFRTWWAVLVPLLVLAVGVIWSLAFQLWMGYALDIMSVVLPTILAVVGLASLVHFLSKYLQLVRHGYTKERAIKMAYRELLLPVFLTSSTTSIGFFSLYFTDVPVLKMFGVFTGTGVMIMFMAVILASPGLLYLVPGFDPKALPNSSRNWDKGMRILLGGIFRFQKQIIFGFVSITILSIAFSSQLKINGYLLDNLPEESPLLHEFRFFDSEFGGSKPIEIFLEVGPSGKSIYDWEVLREIEKLEEYVQMNFAASNLVSPVFVAKFLNNAQNGGNERAFRLPSRGQLNRMEAYLDRWSQISPIRVNSDDFRQGRISGRTADVGSLLSGKRREEFAKFVENEISSNLLHVRLTGTSHLADLSHQNVTIQLAKGIGLAFLLVGILAGIMFNSWMIGILVLVPNVVPLLWVAGFMWLVGAELSLSTAVIFTVSFGIAVDDTIHFMTKLQSEIKKGKPWVLSIRRTYLETGKAIILSSLVLISGFGILVFSQFGVTFYLGLLISLALLFALVADLGLLPVLLLIYGKHFRDKG